MTRFGSYRGVVGVRRAELDVEPAVAVDDVVAAPPLDAVAAVAAEDDVAAVKEVTPAPRRSARPRPGDAASLRVWSFAAFWSRCPPRRVAAQDVVEVPAGQALDQVEAVAEVVDVGAAAR